jgi:phospholipid/cholesterol/gamma-HCH transport system substrate-binding protein
MTISASQRARLGAFMTAGAVCLAVLVAIPVGIRLADHQKSYYAFFEGESLSGLERGATVKFHGVPVGKVDKISYNPKDLLRVKITMLIQADFPMKQDMIAQTGDMGITGLKYVELLGGTNESPLLKPGSTIPTKKSMMATITGQAEVIAAKIEVLLNHLNAVSNPDSLAGIKKIVDNVASISDDTRKFLSVMRPDLEQVANSFQGIVLRVDSISKDVKTITGETSLTLGNGHMSTILQSIDSTTQALKHLSNDLSLIVKQSREDVMVSIDRKSVV